MSPPVAHLTPHRTDHRSGVRPVPLLIMLVLMLTGCGIQPTGVSDTGEPPTGVAAGPTLYFLDAEGGLVAQQRDAGRLGTISEALTLLLLGPGSSGVRTGIAEVSTTRVEVTVSTGLIDLVTPLAPRDLSPDGYDQIVCTALATHIQRGGDADTRVRIGLTHPYPGSDSLRTCPVLA